VEPSEAVSKLGDSEASKVLEDLTDVFGRRDTLAQLVANNRSPEFNAAFDRVSEPVQPNVLQVSHTLYLLSHETCLLALCRVLKRVVQVGSSTLPQRDAQVVMMSGSINL